MERSKLKYHDLIFVLIQEIQVLCDLFEGDNKYERLLQELKKYNIGSDFPLQRNLSNTLNISKTQLMDLMQDLYFDFEMNLWGPKAYPVSEKEVWFLVNFREGSWTLVMDGLEIIPRVGDDFSLDFVRGERSGRHFHVERVLHELEGGVHKIFIYLEEGYLKHVSESPEE